MDREYTIKELERVIERLKEIAQRRSGIGEDVDLMIAIKILRAEIEEKLNDEQNLPKETDARTALIQLFETIDYTSGKCRPNEMIAALVPEEEMRLIRNTLNSQSISRKSRQNKDIT